jgi:hypothetical protein
VTNSVARAKNYDLSFSVLPVDSTSFPTNTYVCGIEDVCCRVDWWKVEFFSLKMSGSNPRDHNDSPSLGNGDHSSRSNRNDTDLKNGEDGNGNGDHVNEKKKSDEERYSDEKKHRKKEKKVSHFFLLFLDVPLE